MNKIYKVVWSEARNCYVVVSELAKKCIKPGRSTAALLAVLALTTGAVSIPAEAATNGAFTTGTDANGNFTAHIDEENNVKLTAENNYIFGDGNTVANLYDSWIFGNNNQLSVNATRVTGNSIVIGNKNIFESMFDNSIVLGNNNNSFGNVSNVLVFGSNIELGNSTDDSVVIGNSASNGLLTGVTGPGGNGSVVIGYKASNESPYSIVLGSYAKIGNNPQGSGQNIAIGAYSEVGNSLSHSIAIGSSNSAEKNTKVDDEADWSIAMGYAAQVGYGADHSMAIGGTDTTIGRDSSFSTALGSYAKIYDNVEYGTVLGYRAEVSSGSGTSIGSGAAVRSDYSIAIGGGWDVLDNNERTEVESDADEAIALGHRARVQKGASHSIAQGAESSVAENASDSIAIGYKAEVLAKETGDPTKNASAVGAQSQAKGNQSSAFGYGSKALYQYATAVGGSAEANAYAGLAVGPNAEVSANYGTALGYKASVGSTNNVALGSNSTDASGVGGYKGKNSSDAVSTASNWDKDNEWLWGQQVKVGDFAGWQAAGGTISVGSAGAERTITNVAAGRIAADSTDAINGSQLYQVAGNLQNQIDEIKSNSGDDHYHTVNGNDKENASDNTGVNVDGDINAGTDNTFDTETGGEANAGSSVSGGTGTDPVGDKPELGGGYVPESGNGNLLIKWDTDEAGKKYYDISLNKDLNIDSVNVNNKITVGDKVTITGDSISVGDKVSIKDDSINVGDITINENNIDMNNNKIINVAEGTAGTDAVNVNQLKKVEQNITNKVNKLDGKINKVGAGAAALAALHPLDFDPDEKLSFSAGVGHYEDATAAAIGAFYQPNDDTLFSLGGTVGNGEEMVNMGITFRFGQNSNQSRSKKAMAKEIIELRTEVAELKAMVYSLTNQRFDIYKSAVFPDTPENHWAYDYVAAVAGNGILEGYPSGRFDGSRSMTRYEMAAVVYRLMTQGVQVDQRMLDEFAPELARIRVDTLSNYSDGTPHIQRVRVIEGRG